MFLVSTCPHCQSSKVTLNVRGAHQSFSDPNNIYIFAICKHCYEPTIFLIHDTPHTASLTPDQIIAHDHTSLEDFYTIEKIIRLPENILYQCPEHVPDSIKAKFNEAAKCHAYDCFCASAAMLRLCLDTVTRDLLTEEADKKKSLYNRINTLFNTRIFSERLHVFAEQIRLDGNTALHEGLINTNDLEDLFDFTIFLLEDLYTYRKRMNLIIEKQAQRKNQGKTS
ncbi:unnamed protein product [Commensalibacter communis]|uniref:DUF4145 domain-containing protein n=1 Tax=Commensalibacter communis TaxID=2972786 RepID=UPI0022FF63CA|nr:DUF4145 domain-containing protein [Commensalibacter communis]CAI3956558.1 unnamed protein product [Commensalibacter communis]